MKIIVEESEVELKLPDRDVTLKQVIKEVEEFLLRVGKVPVGLNIDGQELTQEELEAREKGVLSGEETLKFTVRGIFGYLIDHLDGAAAANEKLLEDISAFAKGIHEQESPVDGQSLVVELTHFFDFWRRMSRLVPDDVAQLKFGSKKLEQVLEELSKLFEEIVEAMEEQDVVLASDLLRYEVVPTVEAVDRAIPSLRERLLKREEDDRREAETLKHGR